MTTVVLASRNRAKVAELHRILTAAGVEVDLLGVGEVAPDLPDVAETGTTFLANALLKARAVAAATGLPAVADDSGLCVDALNGMPGVLSARWCGQHGADAANTALVLAQLADVPDDERGGYFACAAVAVLPGGDLRLAEGTVRGTLTREPRGAGGFGYDPIFTPYGHDRTTAEMSPDEKDAISHRGIALRTLAPQLGALLRR